MGETSKILVVDDKPENIFSLKQILAETKAEVISASNGNEALVTILNHNFALAILDVQMPDMDGYELAEFIRSEKKTNGLPIIFVSAIYSSEYHMFKGYDSGAVDFLVKPFEARILLGKVDLFIKLDQQNRRLQQSEGLIREQYDALKASELRFQSLVNTIPDIVYKIDPEGNFTFVNEAIKKLEDGLKKTKNELEDNLRQKTAELVRENTALTAEIGKRKHAEQSTLKAKQEWQEIFNAIGQMAMVLDREHHILAVNNSTVKLLDKPPEALIGKKCYEVFHDASKNPFDCPARDISQSHGEHSGELTIESMNKSFIVSCTPIFDDKGTLKRIIHIMTDISERKRLEKDLIQAHKMEAIGTLAGGIAHDFNNILTSLLGYTQLILSDVEKGTQIEQDLNEVYKAGLRAKELVRQILTFARKSEDEKMSLRLDLIVKEVLKFLRSSIPANIVIQDNINCKSKVMANATQIHQVVMNLCTNAAHAMNANGGTLEVALREVTIDCYQMKRRDDIKPGKYLELTISDTGTGIPAPIIDRIFEPYFTTKNPEEGTGMGLALVQSIVKEAKGMVTVESKLNQGTSFKILFPITEEEKRLSNVAPSNLVDGQGNILLVDDEIVITKLGKRYLERYGYKVTPVNNPKEALTVFSENPDLFDVVVTDLTMPDMKGDRLIAEIQQIRPGTPCILCTGYSSETDQNVDAVDGLKAILIKPIEQKELVSTLQLLLKDR